MRQNYQDVAKRLYAYRQSLHQTQERMGAALGISQSYYAKLESGTNTISYDCLKTFERNGGDVHFLITGKELDQGFLEGYIDRCEKEWAKIHMFRIAAWLMELGVKLDGGPTSGLPDIASRNLRLAQSEMDEPGNIWRHIRVLNRFTQIQLADMLGINIKRYLRLEREITKPDAEILYRLYVELGYVPTLLLDPPYSCLAECNGLWEEFSPETKAKLKNLLDQAANLVCEDEEHGKT